jgi:predicted transcriptional regulator
LPKRGRPQRREVPASPEVARAQQLARKRARLEAQLEQLTVARWRTVMELRAAGVSQLDCAELLDVTKARAQQLVREAEAHYGVTVDQLAAHLSAGGQVDDLLA